ncbi:hypothetical protein RchiOBHm_Chr5g0027511 [Rosa chinensis]|uniref:Uncharacterized protein n=1 Tax=Rosa chinensis TaxID=74649 RepID=A0A2P6Q955_ROSCH|nr:hypothetical protein RchiOBHm_Chr5g0027511 [Rosa chinensis]
MFMKLLMFGLLFESCGIDEVLWWNSEENIEKWLEVGGSVGERKGMGAALFLCSPFLKGWLVYIYAVVPH